MWVAVVILVVGKVVVAVMAVVAVVPVEAVVVVGVVVEVVTVVAVVAAAALYAGTMQLVPVSRRPAIDVFWGEKSMICTPPSLMPTTLTE